MGLFAHGDADRLRKCDDRRTDAVRKLARHRGTSRSVRAARADRVSVGSWLRSIA